MKVIQKNGKIIYKASKGKKILFLGEKFSEVVLRKESKEIKEVKA